MPKGFQGFQKGHKIWLGRKHLETSKTKIGEGKKGKTPKPYIHKPNQGFQKGNRTKGQFKIGCVSFNRKPDEELNPHNWVKRYKGQASKYKCQFCDRQAYGWSNKDHKYRKVLEDWQPLCPTCHLHYDNKFNNSKIGFQKSSSVLSINI